MFNVLHAILRLFIHNFREMDFSDSWSEGVWITEDPLYVNVHIWNNKGFSCDVRDQKHSRSIPDVLLIFLNLRKSKIDDD